MPRDLSQNLRVAANAQETGEAVFYLLTFRHPSFVADITVCNNAEDLVSNGITYQRFPFEVSLPNDDDSAPPQVKLTVDNVDRRIVQALRSVNTPITVLLQLVSASTPDVVEGGPAEFKLRAPTFDASVVEGTLMFEDILNEPFPASIFSPRYYPGLFNGA